MLRLKLADTDEIEAETQLARRRTLEVALDALAQLDGSINMLREEHLALLRQSEGRPESGDETLLAARRHLVSVQRRALIELRRRGAIGDDAFHVVEQELDSFEFYTERRIARFTAGAVTGGALIIR